MKKTKHDDLIETLVAPRGYAFDLRSCSCGVNMLRLTCSTCDERITSWIHSHPGNNDYSKAQAADIEWFATRHVCRLKGNQT